MMASGEHPSEPCPELEVRGHAPIAPYYSDESVTLYHGDALAVLRDLPSASVDALITDPPYSSGGAFRGDRMNNGQSKYVGWTMNGQQMGSDLPEFTGDNRDQRGYMAWVTLWLTECLRVAKPGAFLLMFTDWRQLPTTTDAIQSGGWVWRGIVVWDKEVGRPLKGRFRNHVEYVCWGTHGPLDAEKNPVYLPSVYRVTPPSGDREHMTQKPIRLMRELVKVVPLDGVILDPFMGSGTTGAAAVAEGRRFIGVEMVEHYAEIATRRIRTAAGQAIAKGHQDALDFEGTA